MRLLALVVALSIATGQSAVCLAESSVMTSADSSATTRAAIYAAMDAATAQDRERLESEPQEINTDSTVEAQASMKVELTVGWEIIAIVGILVAGSVAKKAIDND